ncbi:hypothetical protein PM082_013696, partial [Marasmius tenuissimus]
MCRRVIAVLVTSHCLDAIFSTGGLCFVQTSRQVKGSLVISPPVPKGSLSLRATVFVPYPVRGAQAPSRARDALNDRSPKSWEEVGL